MWSKAAEAHFKHGNHFLNSKQLQEAVIAYDKAIALNPNDPGAFYNKGLALSKLCRFEDAVAAYVKAISLNPDNSGAFINKGVALMSIGKLADAVAAYDKAIALNSNCAVDAFINKGVALMSMGKCEDAVAAYDQAIALNPNDAGAFNNKGLALNEMRHYEKAILAYDRAIELNPKYANAFKNRGFTLINLRNYENAVIAFDKAIEINSSDAGAFIGKGTALDLLAFWEDAAAAFDKAIELNPNSAMAWSFKGNVFMKMARFDAAAVAYGKAAALNPMDAKAFMDLGNALDALCKYEDAVNAYDKAISLNSQSSGLFISKAAALMHLCKFEEAVICCDKAISLKPNYAGAYISKGIALKNMGRYLDALTAYDMGIAIDSNYSGAFISKGAVLMSMGRYEDAIAAYDNAIDSKQSDPAAFFNKGIALMNGMNKLEDAVVNFDKAIVLDPAHLEALKNKAKALRTLGKLEEAVAAHDQVIGLDPSDSHALICKGSALKDLGRLEDAVVAYDQAIALNAGDAKVFFGKGNILKDLGRFEEAVDAFDKATMLSPSFTEAFINKGLALMNMGRCEDAVVAYDRAMAINPLDAKALLNKGNALSSNDAQAYLSKGNALKDMGKFEEAIVAYDKAIALNPNFAVAFNNRGIALKSMGSTRYFEALEYFEAAVKLSPEDPLYLCNKGELHSLLGENVKAFACWYAAIELTKKFQLSETPAGECKSPQRNIDYVKRTAGTKRIQLIEKILKVHSRFEALNGEQGVLSDPWLILAKKRLDLAKKEAVIEISNEIRAFSKRIEAKQDPDEKFDIFHACADSYELGVKASKALKELSAKNILFYEYIMELQSIMNYLVVYRTSECVASDSAICVTAQVVREIVRFALSASIIPDFSNISPEDLSTTTFQEELTILRNVDERVNRCISVLASAFESDWQQEVVFLSAWLKVIENNFEKIGQLEDIKISEDDAAGISCGNRPSWKILDRIIRSKGLELAPVNEIAAVDAAKFLVYICKNSEHFMFQCEGKTSQFLSELFASLVLQENLEVSQCLERIESDLLDSAEELKASSVELSPVRRELSPGGHVFLRYEQYFSAKELKRIRKKSAKGKWFKTWLSPGEEVEEFLAEDAVKKRLKCLSEVISQHDKVMLKAVVFRHICKGIVERKGRKNYICAAKFAELHFAVFEKVVDEHMELLLEDSGLIRACVDALEQSSEVRPQDSREVIAKLRRALQQ